MKTIKLTTPWDHNYIPQIPTPLKSRYKFEINNDCDEADYWFVWGAVRKKERVFVPHENTYFIVDEAFKERQYKKAFLNQFEHVITCRNDINHTGIIKSHYWGIWYFKKDFDELYNLEAGSKEKKVSIVSSDLTWLDGHKRRYAFVNKLIGHFKDKIDVFGRGFNFIEDKFDALYPYRYSVAIENDLLPDYFSEKIFECYLTHTIPIYYGCPNIDDYFAKDSYFSIDINDFKSSIITIERLIEDDSLYFKHSQNIIKERDKVLNEYHTLPAMVKIIEANNPLIYPTKKKVIIQQEFGGSYLSKIKQTVKRISS